jgi:hypothetical protein
MPRQFGRVTLMRVERDRDCAGTLWMDVYVSGHIEQMAIGTDAAATGDREIRPGIVIAYDVDSGSGTPVATNVARLEDEVDWLISHSRDIRSLYLDLRRARFLIQDEDQFDRVNRIIPRVLRAHPDYVKALEPPEQIAWYMELMRFPSLRADALQMIAKVLLLCDPEQRVAILFRYSSEPVPNVDLLRVLLERGSLSMAPFSRMVLSWIDSLGVTRDIAVLQVALNALANVTAVSSNLDSVEAASPGDIPDRGRFLIRGWIEHRQSGTD